MIAKQSLNDTEDIKARVIIFTKKQKEALPSASNKRPITGITDYILFMCLHFHSNHGNDIDLSRPTPQEFLLVSQKLHASEPKNLQTLNVTTMNNKKLFLKLQCRIFCMNILDQQKNATYFTG
jgi:hypothetical protein